MTADRTRRFEPWPWMIAALLAAMIGSSLLLWSVASAHRDGLVAQDAWQAGLDYNAGIAAREAARALGIALDVETRPLADGVRVEVRLVDPERRARVHDLRVERLRPAESGLDAGFALLREGDRYVGDVPLPRRGRWRLAVVAELETGPLRTEIDHWHEGQAP